MHGMAYTIMPTSKVENTAMGLSHWLMFIYAKSQLTKPGQRGKLWQGKFIELQSIKFNLQH